MDEWMGGWLDGRMDGWIDGRVDLAHSITV